MDTGNEGTIIRIPLLLNITATLILFTNKKATTIKHHCNVFYKGSNFHILSKFQILQYVDECLLYLHNVCVCVCVCVCMCVCVRVCVYMHHNNNNYSHEMNLNE